MKRRPFHLSSNILRGVNLRSKEGGSMPPFARHTCRMVVDLISSIDRSAVTLWIFTSRISA